MEIKNKTEEHKLKFDIVVKQQGNKWELFATEEQAGITKKTFENIAELWQYLKFYVSCFTEETEEIPF